MAPDFKMQNQDAKKSGKHFWSPTFTSKLPYMLGTARKKGRGGAAQCIRRQRARVYGQAGNAICCRWVFQVEVLMIVSLAAQAVRPVKSSSRSILSEE